MAKMMDYAGLKPNPKEGPVVLGEPQPRQNVSAILTPPEIYQAAVHMGAQKAHMSWWKTLWLGVLAGIYLSFGGALLYFVGGQIPEIQNTNPGLQNLIKGFIGLPFGLALIVICGGELYTSNAAYLPVALYEGKATLPQLLKNWFWSFFGNLAGSLFVVWILDETYLIVPGGQGPINSKSAVATSILKTTEDWGSCVARGFFCNYLVCLGVWVATSAQDTSGKILGLLFPIGAFVAIGFEHVIANMFLIPFGMKLGSGVTVRDYIARNMIPVFIGNTLSAVFFVAGSYAFCYGTLPQRIGNLLCGKAVQGHSAAHYQNDRDDDTAHNGRAHAAGKAGEVNGTLHTSGAGIV